MTWTLRRILIIIVALSSLAVAGTLYWVTATYQRFAIDNQHQIAASTVSHLVRRQVEDQHHRKVSPFIDDWSRLSTLVRGMKENSPEKARIAANRMMLTLEVAEGRVQLRNVVIYSKDIQVVATADKGTGESLSVLPILINELRERDGREQRQITSFLWRGSDGRPLYSTIAPIGGFRVAGFVEFVSDPIPDLAGVGDAVQGQFRLLDIHGTTLFESDEASTDASKSDSANEDTLRVPIADALGGTWAIATLTRDVSTFQATVSQLRDQALGIVAAVILGSVLIGWLMLRLAVFRRLKDFAAAMEMLAEGHTDVQIPSVGPDELKIMRTSLESLKNAVNDREEATLALRESEQRLKAIIDNSPNAIYLKDTKGRYTLVNASVAERQGFDPDEMIGMTAFDHYPKEVADSITAQEAEVLQTGKVGERELEITNKDREPYVVLMAKFPVFDADGILVAVGTTTSDITERKATEEALRTSEKRLRFLFEHSPAGLWHDDYSTVKKYVDRLQKQGVQNFREYFRENPEEFRQARRSVKKIQINPAGLQIFGSQSFQDYALWCSSESIWAQEGILESNMDEIAALATGQQDYSGEYLDMARDGSELILQMAVHVPREAAADWSQVLKSVVDITERKQVEKELLAAREKAEELAKLQRIILDNVGQGILVFHENTHPLLWNDLATQFTGWDSAFLAENLTLDQCDEFQRQKFSFDDETIEMVTDFDRRQHAGERGFVVTYQRRGIEGDTWIQVGLRSLSDGKVVQTYQDITNLQQAIDAAQQAQSLAEDANRAKSEFLSNMSHELRTPLNAIIGFTEFVVENDDEPVTHEQNESLSQVLKAGRHLLLLINDVLDLSKIEAGAISLSIEAVDAGLVIDECVSLTASYAAGRNVEVKNLLAGTPLPSIKADRIRFKQVFLNLLSNAIKYNRDSGGVFIEQASTRLGMLRIGVRDEGPGIAEDRVAKMFDPFDRLGAENSAIEGTGIGLTITKSLVEQMGGNITVDSIVGMGSIFWLEMPISERAAEHRVDADRFEDGLAASVSGLILYVEDNPANLELVRKIMSRQPGVDFIEAATGELGIERARAEVPDVILLDINLPGIDGFRVLEALSVLPETRHIPVIALTAAATDSDIKRGQAAGFFSYLTKPIAARELMDTIRRALRPTALVSADTPALLSNGKVLAVDDLPINLAITQRQLAKLGVACDVVEDPEQALKMLRTGGYALALVDIGMPVLNGIELTRRLREAEQDSGTYTPVIALTASYGSKEDIDRYRQAGMDGQLMKPVILKELASTLHRWFSPNKESAEKIASPPPSPEAPSDGDRPPIDLDQFKEILGTDDTEMIQEMFDLFIELMPGELEKLSGAIAARDNALSRESAHRFKSAARNTAARRLSELLQKIESDAQNGCWDALGRDLRQVNEECTRVTAYIQAGAFHC